MIETTSDCIIIYELRYIYCICLCVVVYLRRDLWTGARCVTLTRLRQHLHLKWRLPPAAVGRVIGPTLGRCDVSASVGPEAETRLGHAQHLIGRVSALFSRVQQNPSIFAHQRQLMFTNCQRLWEKGIGLRRPLREGYSYRTFYDKLHYISSRSTFGRSLQSGTWKS